MLGRRGVVRFGHIGFRGNGYSGFFTTVIAVVKETGDLENYRLAELTATRLRALR